MSTSYGDIKLLQKIKLLLLLKLPTADMKQAKSHLPYRAQNPLKCLYVLQFQYNYDAVSH